MRYRVAQRRAASQSGLTQVLAVMSKRAADVDARAADVIQALVGLGLTWENPSSNKITVWNASGDQVVAQSSEAALQLLVADTCLQLWLDHTTDLPIGIENGLTRLFLDGLTAHQVSSLLTKLESCGLTCTAVKDDS